jgi:hypothetical protein
MYTECNLIKHTNHIRYAIITHTYYSGVRMRKLDIAGQRFGSLIAVEVVGTGDKRLWFCRCDCGGTKTTPTYQLTNGLVKSCGCLGHEDLTGTTINRLTATDKVRRPDGRTGYICRCACGNTVEIDGAKWKYGHVRSCGCIRRGKRGPRVPNNGAALNKTYDDYRRNAARKGLTFRLTKDEFRGIVIRACHYCGEMPKLFGGIDRLNNTEGYVNSNAVPCCKLCNYRKGAQSYEEFIAWVRKVANYLERRT